MKEEKKSVNLISDELLAKVLIEALKNNEKDVEFNGIPYDLRDDGFYYGGDRVYTREDVRQSWAKVPMTRKLQLEAPPINFMCISDIIIFRPIDPEGFQKTKLFVPEGAKQSTISSVYKEMPMQGIVVAVGPGFMTDNGIFRSVGCTIGDQVIIRIGSALVTDFLYEGVLYYYTRSSEVIGVASPDYQYYLDKNFTLEFVKP